MGNYYVFEPDKLIVYTISTNRLADRCGLGTTQFKADSGNLGMCAVPDQGRLRLN